MSQYISGKIKPKTATIIEMAKLDAGYFEFLNKYIYLNSDSCYWVANEYDTASGFAVISNNEQSKTKLYAEQKQSNCKVIPVIIAEKINLN